MKNETDAGRVGAVLEAAPVRERPILFSGEMVRAILAGRKTQTRRVVKPQPTHRLVEPRVGLTIGMDPADDGAVWYDADGINPGREVRCPYGSPLDRLWVRETWCDANSDGGPCICYRADYDRRYLNDDAYPVEYERYPGWRGHTWAGDLESGIEGSWRPSIHMPRWASRLSLEITDVRVERVQEISEKDADAEGVDYIPSAPAALTHRSAFAGLWSKLNGPRGYGWDANPWVWCVSFRVLAPE